MPIRKSIHREGFWHTYRNAFGSHTFGSIAPSLIESVARARPRPDGPPRGLRISISIRMSTDVNEAVSLAAKSLAQPGPS
jgi:hypothetical protein